VIKNINRVFKAIKSFGDTEWTGDYNTHQALKEIVKIRINNAVYVYIEQMWA